MMYIPWHVQQPARVLPCAGCLLSCPYRPCGFAYSKIGLTATFPAGGWRGSYRHHRQGHHQPGLPRHLHQQQQRLHVRRGVRGRALRSTPQPLYEHLSDGAVCPVGLDLSHGTYTILRTGLQGGCRWCGQRGDSLHPSDGEARWWWWWW